MPTNDRKVNIYQKRLLSRTALKDQFLDYLQGAIDEITDGILEGESGTLDRDKVGLNNDHGGNTFDIDTTDARKVVAGGHTIDLSLITGESITHTIPFENGLVPYHVGVFYAEVETGIEINPRTGDPEYQSWKQSFGNVDHPTAITDASVYIRIDLTSITESGIDHSGRKVRVWLVDPVSPDEAIAFFDGIISYTDPMNYVDIPYSGGNGPLGQDTSGAPPSTDVNDYKVFIEGITWRGAVDLRTIADCAYLGNIAPGSPPVFDISEQPCLQWISLNRAYIGGNSITVDAGAVDLVTPDAAYPASDDPTNAQLILDRKNDESDFQIHLLSLGSFISSKAVPLALMDAEHHWGGFGSPQAGTKVGSSNVINFVGTTLTQVRGTDLKNQYLVYIPDGDVADRGLFKITAYTDTSVTVTRIDATVPNFTAGTCSVWLLFPRLLVGPSDVGSGPEWVRGIVMNLRDGEDNSSNLNILPEDGKIKIWDRGPETDDTRSRRSLMVVDPSEIGNVLKWPFNLQRSVIVRGGDGTDLEGDYERDGVRIYDAGGAPGRDPCFPFCYDLGYPEQVDVGLHTYPALAIDRRGIPCRGHHFEDHFFYAPADWFKNGTALLTNLHYVPHTTGTDSTIKAIDYSAGGGTGCQGCVALDLAPVSPTGSAQLEGPLSLYLDSAKGFKWVFRARVALGFPGTADLNHFIGLQGNSPTRYWYFEKVGSGNWALYYDNGGAVVYDTGVNALTNTYQWFEIEIGETSTKWTICQKDTGTIFTHSTSHPTLSGEANALFPFARIERSDSVIGILCLDFWGWYDAEIIYGRHGNSWNQVWP